MAAHLRGAASVGSLSESGHKRPMGATEDSSLDPEGLGEAGGGYW